MLGLTERERRSSVEDSLLFPELVEVDRTLRVVLGMIHNNVTANTTFLSTWRSVSRCEVRRAKGSRTYRISSIESFVATLKDVNFGIVHFRILGSVTNTVDVAKMFRSVGQWVKVSIENTIPLQEGGRTKWEHALR